MTPSAPAGSEGPASGINWSRVWTQAIGVGGLAAIVGAFLPWVRLQTLGVDIAHSGIAAAGDGYITLGIGALLAALTVRTLVRRVPPSRAFGWTATIGGFFLLSIPALDFQAFRQSLLIIAPDTAGLVRPEIGLYATMIGGILAIVGGWLSRRRGRREAREARGA